MRFSMRKWAPWMAALLMGGSLGTARAELLLYLEGDKVNTPAPNVMLDSSGNGNHGLAFGSVGPVVGGKNGGGSLGSPGGAGNYINFPIVGTGVFDSISDNQTFTVSFWMSGGDANPQNTSVFWANGVAGQTDRAFQAHIPWSNENVYFDIGGCCGPTQRVNTQIDRQYWRAADGDEWTHWAFTLDEFGDAAVYINGEVALGTDGVTELFRFGPTEFVPPLANFWLFAANGGGGNWQGRLDDIILADEALTQNEIQELMNDGVRSVFAGLPAEAPEYTPTVQLAGGFMNLGGKLGGYLEAPEDVAITSWRVGRVFAQVVNEGTPNEQVIESVLNLGTIPGFSGSGEVGSQAAPVQIGDLDLSAGVDDQIFRMRLTASASADASVADPIIGQNFTAQFETDILVPGTGGGTDPFVLMGDLNQDGQIGLADFNILKSNFGATQGSAAVPEPSTVGLALLGLATLCFAGFRRMMKKSLPWLAVLFLGTVVSPLRAELLLFYEGDKVNTPLTSVVLDSSGKGNHGVFLSAGGLTSDGHTGGALDTTGGQAVVNTPGTLGAFDSIVEDPFDQAFTVAFWMAGNANNPINSSVFWAEAPGQGRAFQAHITWGDGNLYYDIAGCCGPTQRLGGRQLDEALYDSTIGEEWTHYAFTMNADGDAAVYIDGQLGKDTSGNDLFRAGPTSEIMSIATLFIGATDFGGGNRWQGRLDDFIVADEALSGAQIADLYANGVRSVFAGLPDEPEEYTPIYQLSGGLSNVGGKLGGYLDAPNNVAINSWRVARVFEQVVNAGTPEETTAELVLDLGAVAGFSGSGEIGSQATPVQIGDLSLAAAGDDQVYRLRLTASATADTNVIDPDPIVGASFSQTFDVDILVPGTGGGGEPDPFTLMGDLNQDGQIGLADFNILKSNFGATQGSAAVPEPSTVALAVMGLASLCVVALRRRK